MKYKMLQIAFLQPQWFILLLIIPLLLLIYIKYQRGRTPNMLFNNLSNNEEPGHSSFSPPDYLIIIRSLAIVLVIISLADPQTVTTEKVKSSASETAIVFALDVSKSMLLEDVKPNRLEALKDVMNKFVTVRSQDDIGIVLYAGESMNWCPLTKNHPLLLNRINRMDDNALGDGTAIGSGLASAINILKQSKIQGRVIILLTDGENNAGAIDPLLAAEFARRLKIKIYTIGIGKTGFAQMPLTDLDGKKYYQNIFVTLNDTSMKKIATITGGLYFNATNALALQKIYTDISTLETKQIKWITKKNYSSCFSWFAMAALVSLCLELTSRFTYLRTWPL